MLKKLLFLLGFLSFSNWLQAQYTFTKVNATELVPTSLVFLEILQTSDDNIWIACNSNKILRFDGADWILYDNTSLNLDGFSFLKSIYEDPEGRVWFTTSGGGLTYFYEDSWTTFTAADGLPTAVNYSAIFYNDKMYFSGSNGVMTYDGNSWVDQDIPNAFSSETQLGVDGDGNLWILFKENNSAFRSNGMTWEEVNTSNSDICYNNFNGMHTTGAGDLWFYGDDGKVCHYDGTNYTSDANLADWGIGLGGKITTIDSDGVGDDVWIASSGTGTNGLVHRKNGVNHYYTIDDGLNSNWITDLVVANDGQTIYAISVGTLYTGKVSNSVSTKNISAKENNWTLSPNPTDGIVMIDQQNNVLANEIKVEIFSIEGKLLSRKQQNISEGIDLSYFSTGWYALRITSENQSVNNMKVFKK